MVKQKINIKERVSEGEIDLSMSDLQDVPVKDIAIFKKATSLDLSNNHLKQLPANFATLVHLTKLDLSKNRLTELPENFGELTKLRYLDLYQNQIQYLPLSFSKLKTLKWLDLKDNPLVPAVAKVAGPCLDAQQCQSCAKDIVSFFTQVQEQVASDLESREKQRQKQLEVNQQKQMENKKGKKKEKTKVKKENGPVANKEIVPKAPAPKKHKKVRQPSKLSPMVKGLMFLFGLVLIPLFIITSIKFRYTLFLEDTCVDLFNRGVTGLPVHVQEYAEAVGEWIRVQHDTCGNATLKILNFTHEREALVHQLETVNGYVKNLFHLIQEQYKKYFT